jgi:hypothetical protein
VDELFNGHKITINKVASVGRAEDMFGLNMGGALHQENVDDVGVDRHF